MVVLDQQANNLIKDLDDGLILRRAVPADSEQHLMPWCTRKTKKNGPTRASVNGPMI